MQQKCAHMMHILSHWCSNWGWLWLSLLSLPLYTKFSYIHINLLQYQFWVKYSNIKKYPFSLKKKMLTTKYRERIFINQLLYEVIWGLTLIGSIEWWCGTSTCRFHIRSLPFYGTNTELSQISMFHSIIKCYDNILLLCSGVEFQCKVNNDTSTPWDRYNWGLEWHENNGKQITKEQIIEFLNLINSHTSHLSTALLHSQVYQQKPSQAASKHNSFVWKWEWH